MKCYSCGNAYGECKGTLLLESKFIGSHSVFLSKYYKCSGCGELLLPKEAIAVIEAREKELLHEMVSKLPLDQFITAAEAAEMLGITRQAFHKHQRIRKGFIYSAMAGGKRLYNKKSVQLFRETKDGRFPLKGAEVKNEVKYLVVKSSPPSVSYPATDDKLIDFTRDNGMTYQYQKSCFVIQ